MVKVLVVDDEVDIGMLLKKLLEKRGVEVAYCGTIRAALANLSVNEYELVFVDLNLTDGSGYDLIAEMKAMNRHEHIIVVSAYDGERQKALQAGAAVFVAKPFTNKSIQEAMLAIQK